MVFFEDKDEDGFLITKLDNPSDPEDLEVIQRLWYYPFGMDMEGIGQAVATPDQAYRYNGKELDEATGLYDYGARYYDPAIARWGQVDPLADAPLNVGTSPYAYVWNNPIQFIDPDGMHGTSHHIDEDGRVIGSDNDGDKNTYVHKNGTTLEQVLEYNKAEGKTSGGGLALQEGGLALLKWSPNSDYTGNPYDPLHANEDDALTPEQFAARYKGQGKNDIVYENTELYDGTSFEAPSGRYVKDPKTGYVIDMYHFIESEKYGKFLGDMKERRQGFEFPNSGHHPQDYFSNSLGLEFARAHTTSFLSSTGLTSRVKIYPGGFVESLTKWLNNR